MRTTIVSVAITLSILSAGVSASAAPLPTLPGLPKIAPVTPPVAPPGSLFARLPHASSTPAMKKERVTGKTVIFASAQSLIAKLKAKKAKSARKAVPKTKR